MRIGVEAFSSSQLTAAREFRCKTKSDLAAEIGVSVGTVTKWEQGIHPPEPQKLHDLAWALDFPISWFTAQANEVTNGTEFYRSRKSTEKRQKRRMSVILDMLERTASFLDHYVEFPDASFPDFSSGNARNLADEDVLSAAIKCRKLFGFGLGPAGNIIDAMERRGAVITRCSVGGTKIDGVSQWRSTHQRPFVVLAMDKSSPVRSRFDIAHELGHIVLHKPSTVDFDSLDDEDFEVEEQQADLFASEFLFPTEAFRGEFQRFTLDEFLRAKLKWRVSIKSMIYKASRLELISKAYTTNLYKNYSRRGWHRGEPHDDLIAFEKCELLSSALKYVAEEEGVELSHAASAYGLTGNLLEEILDEKFESNVSSKVVPFVRPQNSLFD